MGYTRILKKIFYDKYGNFVVFQKPNIPVLVACLSLLGYSLSSGREQELYKFTSLLSFGIWALLELALGVNYFRRIIGLAVLIFLLFIN